MSPCSYKENVVLKNPSDRKVPVKVVESEKSGKNDDVLIESVRSSDDISEQDSLGSSNRIIE